ncbi:hypothetical protein AKI39_13085 [Bordetella sp. H567]|uniref:hypothetical protein n=1 Tax=Bordetella sp. H567 TaxID=1697043 RepID=UPI00081D2E3C|nr:hypothetical protein [Bordetella sp. H567]AOB31424.1 hypothetical protein AKI39_13085 [Bordetella sp. H567]
MKAEPYDVTRMAAQLIQFVLAAGLDIEDSIRTLETAERLLRETSDRARRQDPEAGRDQPSLH